MLKKLKNRILEGDKFLLWVSSRFYCLIGNNKIQNHKNKVIYKGNYLKRCKFNIIGKNNEVIISPNGMGVFVDCNFYIRGNNNRIIIGSQNSMIKADMHIEDDNGLIIFGNGTRLFGYTHLAVIEGTSITFGDSCLFSSNVVFRTGDSHSIIDRTSGKRCNPSKSITIGNRVWFGNSTTVLKGVRIEADSVVSTGCIMTKGINKTNVILGGIPGRIIKENISWNINRLEI